MMTLFMCVACVGVDLVQEEPKDMNNQINPNWLSTDVQARIDPPPIPFANMEETEECHTNTIKVNMKRNPESATSETHKRKMKIFENVQPY